jgi:hypothetical protein
MDDEPHSAQACSINPADTATAIDAYDRIQREGKISVKQGESLKVDAIEDQLADAKSRNCSR